MENAPPYFNKKDRAKNSFGARIIMKKTFTLRVDLESDKGIKEGLPKLLDLLKRYDLKASFYLVMGGESNIWEILKYRKKMASADERKIKVWTLKEKARMALFPKDFVKSNKNILQRILEEGHELGLHGWKHREWTRGLERINIERTIDKAINRYIGLLRRKSSEKNFHLFTSTVFLRRDLNLIYLGIYLNLLRKIKSG